MPIGIDIIARGMAAEAKDYAEQVMVTGGVITQHPLLGSRDLPDAHPISSISGLVELLATKLTLEDLEEATVKLATENLLPEDIVAGSNITIVVNGKKITINAKDTIVTVEDVLDSISTVNALSANQGRILNEKIVAVEDDIVEIKEDIVEINDEINLIESSISDIVEDIDVIQTDIVDIKETIGDIESILHSINSGTGGL